MKMKQAYLDNSKLGDPASVDSQLNENSNKLKKLQLEVEKYEKHLSELNNKPGTNQNSNSTLNGSQTNNQTNRNSLSEESLSRSASDSSVSHPQAINKNGGLNNKPVFKTISSNNNLNNNLNSFKNTLNGHSNNGNSAISSGASSNAGSSNTYEQIDNNNSPDIG